MRVGGEPLSRGKDGRRLANLPSQDVRRQAIQIFEACGILDAVQVDSP